MAQSSKSMLEAFKASGSTAPVQDGTSAKSKAPSPPAAAGGPFANEPPARGEPTPAIEEGLHSLAATQRLRIAVFAVALVAALGIGWMVGSPREVVATETITAPPIGLPEIGASEPESSRPESRSEPTSPAPATSGPVEAIMDPRNEHTIIVATYGLGKQDLAIDLAVHLEGQGYAAWPASHKNGKHIVVLVEARPEEDELDGLLSAVQKLPGPPPNGKPGEFSGAYITRIDSILER